MEEDIEVINGDGKKSNNTNKNVAAFQSGDWANACQEWGQDSYIILDFGF